MCMQRIGPALSGIFTALKIWQGLKIPNWFGIAKPHSHGKPLGANSNRRLCAGHFRHFGHLFFVTNDRGNSLKNLSRPEID